MDICITLTESARRQTGRLSVSQYLVGRALRLKQFGPDEAKVASLPRGGKLYHVYLSQGARNLVARYGERWGLSRPGEVVRAMLHLLESGDGLLYHQARNLEIAPGPRSKD